MKQRMVLWMTATAAIIAMSVASSARLWASCGQSACNPCPTYSSDCSSPNGASCQGSITYSSGSCGSVSDQTKGCHLVANSSKYNKSGTGSCSSTSCSDCSGNHNYTYCSLSVSTSHLADIQVAENYNC
jgi:hypothetical protein